MFVQTWTSYPQITSFFSLLFRGDLSPPVNGYGLTTKVLVIEPVTAWKGAFWVGLEGSSAILGAPEAYYGQFPEYTEDRTIPS